MVCGSMEAKTSLKISRWISAGRVLHRASREEVRWALVLILEVLCRFVVFVAVGAFLEAMILRAGL